MRKSSTQLKKFKERTEFLDLYNDFNSWLYKIGFKQLNTNSPADYNYNLYLNYVDSLHAVEHYYNEIFNINIRFLRDRYEHKFFIVHLTYNDLKNKSNLMNLNELKDLILNELKISKSELDKKNNLMNQILNQ